MLGPRYRTYPSIVAVVSSTHSHVTLFTSEEAVAQAVEQVGAIVDTAAAVFAVASVARVRTVQAARTDIRRAASTAGALADTRSAYCSPCSTRSTTLHTNRHSAQCTCRQKGTVKLLSLPQYHERNVPLLAAAMPPENTRATHRRISISVTVDSPAPPNMNIHDGTCCFFFFLTCCCFFDFLFAAASFFFDFIIGVGRGLTPCQYFSAGCRAPPMHTHCP